MPEHTPAPTPSRSLYGFFMYLFFKSIMILYCIWAFLPENCLNFLGIYYHPLKYWSTAVPIQCLVALTIFAFIIYPSSNIMLSANIDSSKTITDNHSLSSVVPISYCYTKHIQCICKDSNLCLKTNYFSPPNDMADNTVLPLRDLKLSFICKKLYLKKT